MAKTLFKSRRHMTIFEVLIAMTLLSLLLVVLFGFVRELSSLNELTKKTTKQAFQQRYAESRLFYAFTNIVNENESGRTFHFFVTKDESSSCPSLVFTFQNGSSKDPRYGGNVLARLFLDKDEHLCLAIWPLESNTGENVDSQFKYENLLEGVKDLRFSFFVPPDTSNDVEPDTKKDTVLTHRGEWVEEWSKDLKQMPAIVKLEVTFEKDKVQIFAFVLPSSKHPITFIPPK